MNKNEFKIELNKDQAYYLYQILQQEKIKIEALDKKVMSPQVDKFRSLLNSLIKAIPSV